MPQVGKLPNGLQTHNLEGYKNHHPLFLVCRQDPIKYLEAAQGLTWS